MTKKTIIILIIIALGSFFLWTSYLWKFFSCGIAGSYPCVETWSLNVSEKNLIEIIDSLKKEHPELEPPNVTFPTSGRNGYWYDFIFYYADTNEEVQAWVRQNDDFNTTTIAIVALFPHVDSLTPINEIHYGDRKEINRDYSYFENKKQISKFEDKIITLIRQKINDKK